MAVGTLSFVANVRQFLEDPKLFGIIATFFAFSLGWLARSMNRVTFDQQGLSGLWYWLPVTVTWQEVVGISKWNNSLGVGIKIRINARNTLIRSISLSSIYENYSKVMPVLKEKGYTFTKGESPTSITPDQYIPSNLPAKSLWKGLCHGVPIVLAIGALNLFLVRAFGFNDVTRLILGVSSLFSIIFATRSALWKIKS